MLFKLSYTVNRLDIHSDEFLTFDLPNSGNIRLVLRAPFDDERSKGYQSFNALLDILGEFEPTKKALPVFVALFEDRRPPEGAKARTAEEMIYREGPSYGLEYYPDPFIAFIDTIHEKLYSAGRALVSVLRWRYAQEGSPSPISSRGFFCSNNNENSWYPVPGRYSALNLTPQYSVLDPRQVDTKEILGLMESTAREPVGHELLREAKQLRHASPRSAVFIAVSAAEVAVKSAIVDRIPEAAWLIDTMQSPPIVDILTQYFPSLFSDQKQFYEPTKKNGLIKTIYDAVHIRNQMAHKGTRPPSEEKIAEIITAVEALLWMCDYLAGYKWAETHIQRIEGDGI